MASTGTAALGMRQIDLEPPMNGLAIRATEVDGALQNGLALRATEIQAQGNPNDPVVRLNIGEGRGVTLQSKAAQQAEITQAFTTIEAGLGATRLIINVTSGYVSYIDATGAAQSVPFAEFQRLHPNLSASIDKINQVSEKVWGRSLSHPSYQPGAVGPTGLRQPVLGTNADPFLKQVFPTTQSVVNFVKYQYPKGRDFNEFLEKIEKIKIIKKRLRVNIETEVQRLEAEASRQALNQAQQTELHKLQVLRAQHTETWDVQALPITLAYYERYHDQIAAGTITPTKVADIIEKELTAHFDKVRAQKEGIYTRYISPLPGSTTFASDVARQFLACFNDRDAYFDFCLTHGDGSVKNETISDAFVRTLVQLPDKTGHLGVKNGAGFETDLHAHLSKDTDLPIETVARLTSGIVTYSTEEIAEISANVQKLKDAIAPPPAPPGSANFDHLADLT